MPIKVDVIMLNLKIVAASCMVALLSTASVVHSAEVFYLGGGETNGAGEMNASYPLSQRVKDLFDFKKYAENDIDRSGRISGTLTQEIRWNRVSGNRSKSFLENGTDYVSEANINLQEKLWKDYNLEGQMFLRKTDDRRVEVRRDLRMKQFNMKVFNPKNLYEFGDFYADLSAFTLSSSLEGLHADVNPSDLYNVQVVAGRSKSPDVVADVFQRNVAGAKVDWNLFRDSGLFSNFRLGMQAVTTQDDSSSLSGTGSIKDIRNHVAGIDGEFSLTRFLALNYELARSAYIEDEDVGAAKDQKYGTAFRVQPSLNLGKVTTRYLYYYVQPGFYTDAGSAASDKIQHQVNVDYQVSSQATLNLMQNYYWDHLRNSTRTKRTTYDEKSVALNWRPSEIRKSLSLRPYINYQVKDSDDLANTAEGVTRTIGLALNDSLDEKTSYGASYEYRSYKDEASNSSSDYFHRVGLNLSREGQLFNRRLYQSIGPNMDFRRTKQDQNHDVGFNASWTGQYDLLKRLVSRWGYNMQLANNAGPGQNFWNNRNYLEFDFLVHEKRNAHFVLRGERNHYDHENGDQDYDESRVTGRFTINF